MHASLTWMCDRARLLGFSSRAQQRGRMATGMLIYVTFGLLCMLPRSTPGALFMQADADMLHSDEYLRAIVQLAVHVQALMEDEMQLLSTVTTPIWLQGCIW
jgi:hypothetical protein